jgi:hypothetical protein
VLAHHVHAQAQRARLDLVDCSVDDFEALLTPITPITHFTH